MDWDVLFDGVSIADKIISFDIIKGRGSFCKQFTLEVADYSLKASIDLTSVPEEPLIEIRTNTGSGWSSEGTFFIERCSPNQNKDAITLTLWGRDESARLTQPFAKKMYKEYDEDTTLYEIIEEILTDCGLEYSASRMLIDDFIIYANSYSVQGMYPLDVLRQLVSVTDGFLYTDRLGKLWVVKDEYHWSDSATELGATVIESITEREDYPEFGNRVRVGSYADDGELDISVDLQFEQYNVAIGEGITGIAVVTRKDGTPVSDGYKVEWTTDNSSYASWSKRETSIMTHRIPDEPQTATSRRLVSTDYPIRQVHSVTEVGTGDEIDVKEFNGTSIVLDDDLTYTDSAVIIDYSTGYATNTLVGGSTGEVEVDVHAIVETFVRDTQTIRIDTSSGDPTAEQAAFVTIIQRDFITEEIITNPGNVRLDDILEGQTEDGIIDLGLVSGGEHPISIRDVSGYKDTDAENEGLANDTIRVGQLVYTTEEGEETTDVITIHNELAQIQGGTTGQRYHLTAAQLAALSTYVTITSMYAAIASAIVIHAALTTGVHGAGENTLATDLDIVEAIADHEDEADPHPVYALDSEVLKHDGSVELSAPWDIGDFPIYHPVYFTRFESYDMWTSNVTGTGSAPEALAAMELITGINNGSTAKQYITGTALPASWTAGVIYGWKAQYRTTPANEIIYLLVTQDTGIATNKERGGFKIEDGRIWAISGDEVDEEATDTSIDMTQYGTKKFHIYCPSNNVFKFYVNNVLVATHDGITCNSYNCRIVCYIINTAAANAIFRIRQAFYSLAASF